MIQKTKGSAPLPPISVVASTQSAGSAAQQVAKREMDALARQRALSSSRPSPSAAVASAAAIAAANCRSASQRSIVRAPTPPTRNLFAVAGMMQVTSGRLFGLKPIAEVPPTTSRERHTLNAVALALHNASFQKTPHAPMARPSPLVQQLTKNSSRTSVPPSLKPPQMGNPSTVSSLTIPLAPGGPGRHPCHVGPSIAPRNTVGVTLPPPKYPNPASVSPVHSSSVAATATPSSLVKYKKWHVREWNVEGLILLSKDQDAETFLTADKRVMLKVSCAEGRLYVEQEVQNLDNLARRRITSSVMVLKEHFPFANERAKLTSETVTFLEQWESFKTEDAYVLVSEHPGMDLSQPKAQQALWQKGHFVHLVESMTTLLKALNDDGLEYGNFKPQNILYSDTNPPQFTVINWQNLTPIKSIGIQSEKPKYWREPSLNYRDPASCVFWSSSKTSDLWSLAWTCVVLIRGRLHFAEACSTVQWNGKHQLIALVAATIGEPPHDYIKRQQSWSQHYDKEKLAKLPHVQLTILDQKLNLSAYLTQRHRVPQKTAQLIVNLLTSILKWDPDQRPSIEQVRVDCSAIRASLLLPPPTKK